MRYYTKIVSFEIAKRLKKLGYTKDHGYQYSEDGNLCDPAAPGGHSGICEAPIYAEVFDWLIEKDIEVDLSIENFGKPYSWTWVVQCVGSRWKDRINSKKSPMMTTEEVFEDFSECANIAISVALDVLEEDDL